MLEDNAAAFLREVSIQVFIPLIVALPEANSTSLDTCTLRLPIGGTVIPLVKI